MLTMGVQLSLGGRTLAAALALVGLAGCALPNSSNPTLAITQVHVTGERASLDLRVDNPSDFDLTLRSIDWTLIYGPLPVAAGSWAIDQPLPSKGNLLLKQDVMLDAPPLDPDAGDVELLGEMHVDDLSKSSKKAIENTGFHATHKVERPRR